MVNRVHTRIAIDPKAIKYKINEVVNKQFLQEGFEKEVNEARAKGAQITRAYFGAAIRGIGAILDHPDMTEIHDGNNPPRITDVPLEQAPGWMRWEPPVVLPGQWKALSPRYIKQDPPSVTFWKKTGRLASFYREEFMADNRWKQLKYYYRGNRIHLSTVKYRGAVAKRGQFNLLIPGVPTPLQHILRGSFGRRRALRDRPTFPRSVGGNSLNRVMWPEWTRPWLARYAEALGKRYYKALNRHLR